MRVGITPDATEETYCTKVSIDAFASPMRYQGIGSTFVRVVSRSRVWMNTAITGAAFDIDGGQQLVER